MQIISLILSLSRKTAFLCVSPLLLTEHFSLDTFGHQMLVFSPPHQGILYTHQLDIL